MLNFLAFSSDLCPSANCRPFADSLLPYPPLFAFPSFSGLLFTNQGFQDLTGRLQLPVIATVRFLDAVHNNVMNITPLVLGGQEGEHCKTYFHLILFFYFENILRIIRYRHSFLLQHCKCKDEGEPDNLCPSASCWQSPAEWCWWNKLLMKFRETKLAALTGVASNLVARTGNEIPMLYMRDIL